MGILEDIESVVKLEIEALENILGNIDQEYEKVVNLMFKCKGKVVFIGVGKSGIIAKKIVATMISTGTPSIFLHPTEAIHGDLGIIEAKDIVVCLSKSGESSEILDVLNVIKKIGAKVVAITANRVSSLAKTADYILYMPIEKEACPLNLAPTSSTTSMLVLGDALAVALMKLKNFKPENFALFHPGGELGRRLLLKISDIMRKDENNPVININDSISNMIFELTNKLTGALSVIDDKEKLKGIVTDYDIRKTIANHKDVFSLKIKDIMNSGAKHVYSDDNALEVLEFMEKREKPITVVPVLDRKTEKVVGMVHLHDILR